MVFLGSFFGRGSWFSGRGFLLVLPMAAVPFAAKALVGTIPEAVMASSSTHPVTLKEMIGDFVQKHPDASSMIENVMQSGASTLVMHCYSSRHIEIVLNSGLNFHGRLVQLAPAPNTQWIKLTCIVYGTTENAIKSRLSDYGTVLKIRRELVQGIGISVYSVKMEPRKPIPSRITILHYPVNVLSRPSTAVFLLRANGAFVKGLPF